MKLSLSSVLYLGLAISLAPLSADASSLFQARCQEMMEYAKANPTTTAYNETDPNRDILWMIILPDIKQETESFCLRRQLEVKAHPSFRVYERRLRSLKNVDTLKEFNNLQELDVSNNGLRHINGIGALTQIKHLRLDENNISDISELASLKNLETLDLSENDSIVDFSPLLQLPKLSQINLSYLDLCDQPAEKTDELIDILKAKSSMRLITLHTECSEVVQKFILAFAGSNVSINYDTYQTCKMLNETSPKWVVNECIGYSKSLDYCDLNVSPITIKIGHEELCQNLHSLKKKMEIK